MLNCFRTAKQVDEIVNNTNTSFTNTLLEQTTDELVKSGFKWFLGGLASFIVGIFMTVQYHKKTN